MSIYKAPDGSGDKYRIPSDPDERAKFVAAVKEKYGEDLDQTNVLMQTVEFGKAIPRGIAGLALDVPKGIVGLFDIGNDSGLYKGLQRAEDYLRQDSSLAADPRYYDKFSTKLGEGIGSFVPFLGAGKIGQILSKRPGARTGYLSPMYTTPTALAIPTGISAQGDRLQMARNMGEDVSGLTETTAELFGGLIGITEVLPVANILGKVHKNAPLSAKQKLASALQSGAAEGGQEVIASILQDLTARGFYSEQLPIGESLFEEFTIGGIIGGVADLVVTSMAGRKSIAKKYAEEDNLRAEETKNKILNAKKSELALEQGTLEEIQEIPTVEVPELKLPLGFETEPQIEIIMTPQEKFAVVDITNPDSPNQIDLKNTPVEAVEIKEKLLKNFEVRKLKKQLDNDIYNLGLINSSTAYDIGLSIINNKSSDVTANQILNSLSQNSNTYNKLLEKIKKFTTDTGKSSRSYPRLSMTEVKSLLTPKEFNKFASDYARLVFRASEKKGIPSIISDKDKPNTTIKYIKELAASKNIDLNTKSSAVRYAAEKYTGTADFKNMNKGQKELFLAKLHSLPKFNQKTNFPDYRPRNYSAQDMADFVAEMKSNNMTFNKQSLKQIGKSEQFLDDLIFSGRAEKIEGTNDYRIRNNFEFDIARRAEGFNETPEEFGARLTAEGKLSSEVINKLVEQEKIRQEKLLPPAEIIPKSINYAESIQQGKTNKFAKEVRKILNARGLKETGIIISDDILSTTTLVDVDGEIKFDPSQVRATETQGAVKGQYDKNTDTIFLSLNAVNPDGNATDLEIQERLNKVLDHEMIHALRAKDLIKEKEYKYLSTLVKKRKFPGTEMTFYKEAAIRTAQERAGRPRAVQEEHIVEEAIAELFRNRNLITNNPPKVEGIFNKIVEFFRAMGQAMSISGYKDATQIFNDIESGKIGTRERDVIRSTRLGDRIAPEDIPTFARGPRDETSGHVADYVPAQYGPPAHDLTVIPSEEFTPEGYSIFGADLDYNNLRKFSNRRKSIDLEEQRFLNKLKEIRGNPNAEITMYQAAPQRDLREGDIITPFLSEAQYLVDESKITRKEIREADKARRRAEGVVNLQQEKNFEAMDRIMDIFNMPDVTPSKVHTYKLRAGDIRWDGNNGWARWGYFPRIKPVDDIPTFSREADQAYFDREKRKRTISNLESSIEFKQAQLDAERGTMTDSSAKKLEREIKNQKQKIAELRAGDLPTFSRTNLIPEDIEVPFDWASNNRFETGAILDQLIKSRISGTRDNPGPLKMAIVDAFKGKNNRPLLKASKKFLEKFTNKKGNLVLFRTLNIPEGEKIKNYGQLPQDLFASTTLDSRQALKIGRNLFTKAQSQGATWNPEILRYEVPMSKVKGYVPMLLKAMESDFIAEFESDMAGSGIMSQEELDAAIEEADAKGDFYKYQGEQTTEELLADAMFEYNGFQEEAEVLADLRGIKPTYQYSPATKDRQASLINDVPLFSRGRRDDTGTNAQENIQLREALAQAEETVKQTPRGSIPYYNLNASDTALKIAIDFNKDLSAKAPDDIPNFSRPLIDTLPENLQEFIRRTGGEVLPDQSWGARTIEVVKDPITAIKNFFINFRQRYIDQYDTVTKTLLAGKTKEFYLNRINPKTKKTYTEQEAEAAAKEVTLANMYAESGAEQALRMSDKSRGVYQGMLTRGYATDVIDGVDSLIHTVPLELVDANGNLTGETGGLIQILAPLFSNTEVNLEAVFKSYAMLRRAKSLDANGSEIDTPVKPEDYPLIEQIEQQYPEVIETYNNYQNWNNKLIKLAEKKGILSADQSALWREHSSYYPFYRSMIDDSGIKGPRIASGSLPGNPLDIQMKGSEDIVDVDPIEAISRNSLSILTATLKNDAMGKIIRDLETMGLAQKISAKNAGKVDSLFFFEDGNKQHYQVDDPRLVYSLQNVGGVAPGAIGKFLAVPAGLLRDTVTRDPGFVVINILRDTLSSAVTSGAPYTPIIDSVKNMFGSMEQLEQFGVLGGYDYSVDEGSVKQFITRTMRQKGLTPNNSMSPTSAFFKLWDSLGALTTKSDGATRKAVYDGVYKKLKEQGLSEAVAQSEAAYQAQEIINFGRRGSDSLFRIITAAIPFLNARIQGLDVLYRGLSGQYSAVEKQQTEESLKEVQSRIFRRTFFRAGLLVGLTALYYMMVSDTDEYKNLKREVRDDNWVMPIGNGNAVKIPIPFEVGMLFKAIPERIFDMTMGDDAFTRKSVDEAITSTTRQLGTSLNIPFFQPGGGIQLIKPIAEVVNNRNTFTNTEIVPYYQQKKEPGLQSRPTTNEFARIIGEALNISPAKIEHIMRGYTGTLGGYVLTVIDAITRGATGSPLIPSNYQLNKLPVFNRLLLDLDKSGGYQQQFYELRNEVDRAVATINSLQAQQRFDELATYRSNMQGVLNVKGQVRAIERYLDNWRKRRDRILQDENLSITVKSDLIRELELERDMRLAMVPELRKQANIPVFSLNL